MSKVYILVICGFESVLKMFKITTTVRSMERCRDNLGDSLCVRPGQGVTSRNNRPLRRASSDFLGHRWGETRIDISILNSSIITSSLVRYLLKRIPNSRGRKSSNLNGANVSMYVPWCFDWT